MRVEANRIAHALNTRALAQLAAPATAAASALAPGWIVDDEGAVLLRSQLGGFRRPDGMDLTGFEATHNHIHLDTDSSEPEERLMLWATAIVTLYEGLRGATAAVHGRRCVGIVSLENARPSASVRWHLDRGERWLSEDLEGFTEEAVLVVSSEDLTNN